MIIIDAAEVQRLLTWPSLVGALGDMFAGGCEAPARHHHPFDIPGENAGTLLLMPAWAPGRYLGVKIVTVVPDNGTRGLPAIAGTYLLSSAATGETLAILDGASLTAWRTAAASALASKLLSREDSEDLVIVGTGALSARLAAAHASVRPIRRIKVWGRSADKAAEAVDRIRAEGLPAEAITDLKAAVRSADIVSCATLSRAPLVLGDWLKPGAHLDLVGAFNPGMRESDDAAVLRSTLFVDTREGALHEAGDLVQPIRAGLIGPEAIAADLRELCLGLHSGRTSTDEITLFKSVGASLEDLAAAVLVYERYTATTN